MRATFGKLQDKTLALRPGLNCIYAPNESGKSTWSHFLRIMLYGLNTRDRGAMADKNRFAPWSGGTMQGRLLVTDEDGTALTLSRDTQRANAPMGRFSCTYTDTATAVTGIDGQNAGETLLGVPREVFVRSAFIRQSALAVDSDAELERRIAALITTGEEDFSYSQVRERLKKQLNRRRSNRVTGQLPALEREIAELEGQLRQMESLSQQAESAQQRLDDLTAQIKELEAQQAAWQQLQRRQTAQQYAKAESTAQQAQQRAEWLAEAAGTLPEDALLNRMEGQCAAALENRRRLQQAEDAAQSAKNAADGLTHRLAAHPLYPDDEAACKARLDAITAPAKPSPLLMIAGILLVVGGGICAALLKPYLLLLALCGAGLAVVGLVRRRRAIDAQAKAETDRAALEAQIAAYLPLLQRQREAETRREQAEATAEGLRQLQQQQWLALLADLRPYAPTCADLGGAQQALRQLRQQKATLSAAQQTAREAAMRLDVLRQHLPETALADEDAPMPQTPDLPQATIAVQLPALLAQKQGVQSQLDTLTGQLRSLGSDEDIRAQLRQKQQQAELLQTEYDAIALAIDTLDEANTTLQNRFSPALGARAAEIFSRLTAGRYQKVLLNRDFSLETDSEGAQRSVQLLSQGAADQLYLAVRLAICDMVLPEEKHVPLILDDALTSFDDDRLHAALDYLVEEGQKRQILLFTCQKREGEYLRGRENVALLTL